MLKYGFLDDLVIENTMSNFFFLASTIALLISETSRKGDVVGTETI